MGTDAGGELRQRYARRAEELRSLVAQARPQDPGPMVAQVLAAAGDLLRRAGALRPDLEAVDAALRALPDAALDRWSEGAAVSELAGRLREAVSLAVDAALPDEEGDAPTLERWSMQGLQARDQLESALVALERLAQLGRPHAAGLAHTLRVAAEQVDRACRPATAALTALNVLRRAEAALLDEPARRRAWWFSARTGVGDDGLVLTLGGVRPGTLAPADREAGEVVNRALRLPVTSEALLRLDLGLASTAEAAAVRRRASREPELALALAAMEAGEVAIQALERGAADADASPGSRAGPDARHQHPDFTVLVFRRPRAARVVVAPRREGQLAAAALHRPDDGPRGLEAVPGAEGLEFDLPLAARTPVRLVVTYRSGESVSLQLVLE